MRKVRLDFCDFWPGFCKTDNFFWDILKTRFDVELHAQPDFLIYSNRESHVHRVHNCVKIYFAVESFLPDWRECDYAMTCHYLDDPRHLRLPLYVLYGEPACLVKDAEELDSLLASKSTFCSFVVSNAGKRKTQKRVDFFNHLSRYKRVDSGGRYLNNIGEPIPNGPAGKLAFLRQYKFNIAFENESVVGYTTEKIFEAMRARCLPIYWGNPRIAEEFNPRSFLNYLDFPTEEALIEKIIELDRDDLKYLAWMREPYFRSNRPNEFFDTKRLLDFFESIFTTPVRPVSRQRRWFQIGRWVPVKKNRPAPPEAQQHAPITEEAPDDALI